MSHVSASLAAESSIVISDPPVTAVIPTRNLPDLATRAVRSSLGQTYQQMEVVVAIDGPDPATIDQLAELSDNRLRVITLPEPLGGARRGNDSLSVLGAGGTRLSQGSSHRSYSRVLRFPCMRPAKGRLHRLPGQQPSRGDIR